MLDRARWHKKHINIYVRAEFVVDLAQALLTKVFRAETTGCAACLFLRRKKRMEI
jgi:hypothetical protein